MDSRSRDINTIPYSNLERNQTRRSKSLPSVETPAACICRKSGIRASCSQTPRTLRRRITWRILSLHLVCVQQEKPGPRIRRCSPGGIDLIKEIKESVFKHLELAGRISTGIWMSPRIRRFSYHCDTRYVGRGQGQGRRT
jgi:hypothetical protein